MELHDKSLRDVYVETLFELISKNKDVICMEADLGKSTGTYPKIADKFPDNYLDVGVAEANLIGVAAGLAKEGKIPFCASFTAFATRRCYDQLTISVAYANNPVKVIGTAPGVTQGPNGGTHMCFQDLAIMRAMPNMEVFAPIDAYELRSVIKYMAESNKPAYMQLVREKMPAIFDDSFKFDPDQANVVKEGSDVTLVTTGLTTKIAYDALEKLEAEGLSAELIHYTSVKPFDQDTLVKSAKKTNFVVAVENQNVVGGFCSAVCETLSENHPTKVVRLGVQDHFGEVGTQDYLIEKYKFGVDDIVKACKQK
jgi:transketolase